MNKSRTAISIDDLNGSTVHAYIPNWNPYLPVAFSKTLIPPALHGHLKPEARLFAQANLAAVMADQLELSDFELGESAPEFF